MDSDETADLSAKFAFANAERRLMDVERINQHRRETLERGKPRSAKDGVLLDLHFRLLESLLMGSELMVEVGQRLSLEARSNGRSSNVMSDPLISSFQDVLEDFSQIAIDLAKITDLEEKE